MKQVMLSNNNPTSLCWTNSVTVSQVEFGLK